MRKLTVLTTIGAIITAGTSAYLANRHRKRLAEEDAWIDALLAEEESAPYTDPYEAAVGGYVFVRDPLDVHGHSEPYRGKIAEVRPEENGHINVYRLEGDPTWYSQNWIQPDFTGPMTLSPARKEDEDMAEKDGKTANDVAIGYWLATLSDAMKAGNKTEIDEAKAELTALTGGVDSAE
ncbi:hypothetical protein [Alteribacter populi]|uniref:hypothetical protein n=1 Tax=Alteribacter populi TaxID=2011011 RepID=UPI000BBB52AB|nr:hypothetical protein [Alteribacter populi]